MTTVGLIETIQPQPERAKVTFYVNPLDVATTFKFRARHSVEPEDPADPAAPDAADAAEPHRGPTQYVAWVALVGMWLVAMAAFVEEEVFSTRDRTGILLFLSLFEHRVVVLGDSGINQ